MECPIGHVDLFHKSWKTIPKIKRSGSRPSINDIIDFLVLDLQKRGPQLPGWPHFSSLETDNFHCHLHRGKPTYVACWRIIDKKTKHIEVYYVGTHEGAPY